MVGLCQAALPVVLFGLFAGALIDRGTGGGFTCVTTGRAGSSAPLAPQGLLGRCR